MMHQLDFQALFCRRTDEGHGKYLALQRQLRFVKNLHDICWYT